MRAKPQAPVPVVGDGAKRFSGFAFCFLILKYVYW
jgi:hypothetical protein